MHKYLVVYEGLDGDSFPDIFEAFIVSAESASQAKKQVVKKLYDDDVAALGFNDARALALMKEYEKHTHAVCVDNENMYRYEIKRED